VIGRVIGDAVTTVRHPSLGGQRMLVVLPHRAANNDPVLALDTLGAGVGNTVILSSDGRYTREVVGDNQSPARWTIIGIVDEPKGQLVG
jgi:ethanolamine utilization protein EutN